MADALDLGSSGATHEGSSPFTRTINYQRSSMKNEIYALLSKELSSYEAKYIIEEIGEDLSKIDSIIKQRKAGIPLDRIFNKRAFYNHEFSLNKATLSPRADSEILIQAVLSEYKNPKNIVDIGTGSGCLLLTLLDIFKSAHGLGLDISKEALTAANQNSTNINIKNVEFKEADILKEDFDFSGFDLIISNPPYIETKVIQTLDNNVKNFDPIAALDGGNDGLDFYRRFYDLMKDLKSPNIFFEFGKDQEEDIINIFKDFKFKLFKDYNQINRIIYLHKL